MHLLLLLVLFADYPMIARVVSQEFIHTTAPSNRYETQLQVGNVIYIADDVCKRTKAGQSYPARVDDKHIVLQVGDKTCKYRIVGQKVAGKPSE